MPPAHWQPMPQSAPSHEASAQSVCPLPSSSMPLSQRSVFPTHFAFVKHFGSAQSVLPSALSSLPLSQISAPGMVCSGVLPPHDSTNAVTQIATGRWSFMELAKNASSTALVGQKYHRVARARTLRLLERC